ncbi:Outer membrane receptor proteins, mostly Fe transport [Chitinophaga sp. YR573]|uniref:TonB-dependent receptor n=1 Tax=Chitinophaga sp. YR573 TaxID=1881040 RepID=UPI0008CE6848|nr:TonB-dependent receptor [Chitinophaga sp. YR573]SEW40560.1 Outer membrane receptor proteins, mostly Fe transport [Chitinophaga sp. YR573]
MKIRKRLSLPTLLLLTGLFYSAKINAQQRFTLSGTVKSKKNGETIIGATIRLLNKPVGVTTNEYGFYSITFSAGTYNVEISSIGMKNDTLTISMTKDIVQNIYLLEESKGLKEVVVRGQARGGRSISGTQTGVEKLSTKEIKNIPVLLGEKDVLKTIQLLPGIKSAGEGNSGFFVRGGSSDQNQILLDEANVYNASHLLGFFSTFNSDAIKDVTVYKGGMPAQYGGRLSSVLDIKMNDGNNQDYSVSGGIGLISAKLNVEGPIQKDKSSFLITGRRTYADVFLKASPDSSVNKSKLYFYDLNAKMSYELGDHDRLYISGYFGKDRLGFGDQFGINWGNTTGTVRWNHIFSKKLFSNTSLIYSNYDYELNIKSGSNDFNVFSQIKDWNLKQDYQLYAGTKNNVRFGWSSIYHRVRPGEITSSDSSSVNSTLQQKRYSFENAVYVTNTWNASSKLNFTYGLRLTNFLVLGKGDFYNVDDKGEIIDTLSYKNGEVVKSYWNLEPRLAIGYQFNHSSSVKASYVRNTQNMHLISNSTSSTPTDKWVSSTNIIKPEISDQVSVGYYKNLAENRYELTLETYYKSMQNQIDYRDGAEVFTNDAIETQLLYGKGRAYGLECLIRKKTGKLTGWVSYTLSKTERKINGINNNQWYNAKQDRTHDIAVVGIYELNKKWTLSANWIYYTGNAVTFPNGKYTVGGQTVYYYTNRNGYRMPAYHRLDFGATKQLKQRKKLSTELAFSLYNVYGRENAYTITFRDNENNPNKTEAVQTSLFRWVPSVSYNFKF